MVLLSFSVWVPADVGFVALSPSNRRLFNEIVVYQKLFCLITPVASSSYHDHVDKNEKMESLGNDYDDGNENGKKAIGLDEQNKKLARASRFFVHFSAVVARLQRETA